MQYGDIFEYNNVPERGGFGSHSLNTFNNPLWFQEWSTEYTPIAQALDIASGALYRSLDPSGKLSFKNIQGAMRTGSRFVRPTDPTVANLVDSLDGVKCSSEGGVEYCQLNMYDDMTGSATPSLTEKQEMQNIEKKHGVEPEGTIIKVIGESGTEYVCRANSLLKCQKVTGNTSKESSVTPVEIIGITRVRFPVGIRHMRVRYNSQSGVIVY